MTLFTYRRPLLTALLVAALSSIAIAQTGPYARDPKQAVDEAYTQKIKEYTTEPFFLSPLVDYLPASRTVPTPMAVLGDIAGAPGKLPYAEEVYEYMRMVEKASPRVKVYSIGTSEEGREMIAVAVSSEANLARLDENRARLAQLADPRTIGLDDAQAEKLVGATVPVYYITGTIHSPETGAPTALMELVYRLAVDESPYIRSIRNGLVTLVTPVVEVDGRNRQVDVYRWHLANPDKQWPSLPYWGHYVAHDNNRDAMGATLQLTKNVLRTFVDWKAQVLHDLHESVPYLYDNTIGDGPYNAWVDPILSEEWQLIGWNNVGEMTKFGMPGVFAHGTFDTWSPGYLMFIAAMHNGISRLYETFGNAGADTVERSVSPSQYSRTWYRQNPPLPKALWSQRNNNNYQETGLLVSLYYFAQNRQRFLTNFYLKSKRSVTKPTVEGPAAYVLPGDDPRLGTQADLLEVLRTQAVEISRATAPFTVEVPRRPAAREGGAGGREGGASAAGRRGGGRGAANQEPATRTFPAGSYVIRMDQPYSRIADALLDHQYWAPDDPQTRPYDDTGWTFGELFGTEVVRVTDTKVLDATMTRVEGAVTAPTGITGDGAVFALAHNADPSLASLRYRLPNAAIAAAEVPFEAGGHSFGLGSFIVSGVARAEMEAALKDTGLTATAMAVAPDVKSHPVRAARVAMMHTWMSTQTEGWWRQALDTFKIPFDYISTQDVAADADLNAKYDVILFAPVGRGAGLAVIEGQPMWGNPLPWKTTDLTPNIGKIDSTDDMRPGLGWNGLQHLQDFVNRGGLLVTVDDTAGFAIDYGLTHGVSTATARSLKVVGSVLRARTVDPASPIAYGYGETVSIYSDSGPIFNVSNSSGGRGGRGGGPGGNRRPTGRGTADEPDQPQGFPPVEIPEAPPRPETWQAAPVTDEQLRNPIGIIPPAQRPRVVMRYGDARELLVSGLLDGGNEIAQHAMVVDVPVEKGHVVLFSNNPIWRGETLASYSMVFNAILNFDNLDAGRVLDEK